MGVRIESSPEDVQTLEIQYTGLEDVDATAERLKAIQDPVLGKARQDVWFLIKPPAEHSYRSPRQQWRVFCCQKGDSVNPSVGEEVHQEDHQYEGCPKGRDNRN